MQTRTVFKLAMAIQLNMQMWPWKSFDWVFSIFNDQCLEYGW